MKLCKNLKTPFEENSSADWTEYPRPQLKRESYMPLVGEWELYVLSDKREYISKIQVPFPPESRLSGVERVLGEDEKYVYVKSFVIDESFVKDKVLLHFGACDQITRVSVNGMEYVENVGGYLPFCYDVTDSVRVGENIMEVEVSDTLDKRYAYGKQSKKRGGMWYTPISGIWQAVWLESVPEKYFKSLKVTPSLNSVEIYVDGGREEKTLTFDGKTVSFSGETVIIDVDNPVHWTPENPHLYYFTLEDTEDRIESYFALRTVNIEKRGNTPYICLNGKPYFFHGLLDQGYFSDGIYTPATPDGYIFDILEMKKQGFNTLRKHIKIEPELFYYYCDKYGMLVFQDMVNSGSYSFFKDTVLPTLGFKRKKKCGAEKKRLEAFLSDSLDTLDLLYNHPSVVYYTIFNEGWGQFDADGCYEVLKHADPSRIFDTTSGWFFEALSDVESHHVYFKKIKFKKASERPIVLSEFGGYSCKIKGHSFNLSKTYGYAKCADEEDFMKRLEALYMNEIIPAVEKGLCASILTQLSDIEDETNGIVTYDRQYIKTDCERMRKTAKSVFDRFKETVGEK